MNYFLYVAAVFCISCSLYAQETTKTDDKPIPQELYDLGLNECNAACTPSFGKKVCMQLCTCSMNEFKKRMKLTEYLALQAALVKGEVSKQQRAIMDSIAKKCDKELTIPLPKVEKPATGTKTGPTAPPPGTKKSDKQTTKPKEKEQQENKKPEDKK